MEVSGERECLSCGRSWSYYDTGGVRCPHCGSPRSVAATEERRTHTATADDLDLAPAITAAADRPLSEAATEAADLARRHVSARGFLDAGALRPLGAVDVAADELHHVAETLAGRLDPDEAEAAYFLALLRATDEGKRPEDAPPASLRGPLGLAAADAADDYRRAVARVAEGEREQTVEADLEALRDRVRRVRALEGDVDATEREALVAAARHLGNYVRDGEAAELAAARAALDADAPGE